MPRRCDSFRSRGRLPLAEDRWPTTRHRPRAPRPPAAAAKLASDAWSSCTRGGRAARAGARGGARPRHPPARTSKPSRAGPSVISRSSQRGALIDIATLADVLVAAAPAMTRLAPPRRGVRWLHRILAAAGSADRCIASAPACVSTSWFPKSRNRRSSASSRRLRATSCCSPSNGRASASTQSQARWSASRSRTSANDATRFDALAEEALCPELQLPGHADVGAAVRHLAREAPCRQSHCRGGARLDRARAG